MTRPLHPIHPSLQANNNHAPPGFSKIELENAEWLHDEVLQIFTEMVNNGHSFQKALVAIYLTGMHYTLEAQKDLET